MSTIVEEVTAVSTQNFAKERSMIDKITLRVTPVSFILILCLSSLTFEVSAEPQFADFYVDASAASNGDGLSWGTAFNDLQEALSSAVDVNGDGVAAFFSDDNALITDCSGQPLSSPCEGCRGGTCAGADVDCDGQVDYCDSLRLGSTLTGSRDLILVD